MTSMNSLDKSFVIKKIIDSLNEDKSDLIEKIIIFGSFLNDISPNDIDVAVVSKNNSDYLTQAMLYRSKLREVSKLIPLDIVPLDNLQGSGFFLDEIRKGKVVYERSN